MFYVRSTKWAKNLMLSKVFWCVVPFFFFIFFPSRIALGFMHGMKFQVTVRCSKMEAEASEGEGFRRRDILKCVGVSVGMVREELASCFFFFFAHSFVFSKVTFTGSLW